MTHAITITHAYDNGAMWFSVDDKCTAYVVCEIGLCGLYISEAGCVDGDVDYQREVALAAIAWVEEHEDECTREVLRARVNGGGRIVRRRSA